VIEAQKITLNIEPSGLMDGSFLTGFIFHFLGEEMGESTLELLRVKK
jgi:hypothetical protein